MMSFSFYNSVVQQINIHTYKNIVIRFFLNSYVAAVTATVTIHCNILSADSVVSAKTFFFISTRILLCVECFIFNINCIQKHMHTHCSQLTLNVEQFSTIRTSCIFIVYT